MVKAVNEKWEEKTPKLTLITTVYNRRGQLERALKSVERQTWRDFEYIIVDDGSKEEEYVDDIVSAFMEQTDLPVMFIKKPNGGSHTARNCGTIEARGELRAELDADDEFTEDALEKFVEAWDRIPTEKKSRYRGVVARCKDHTGKILTDPFPDNINQVSRVDANQMAKETGVAHCGINVTKLLKDNLWPEPVGITHILEGLVWTKLQKEFDTYYINDVLYIYHMDTPNSYTNSKMSLQAAKNAQWNFCNMLNERALFEPSLATEFRWLVMYSIFAHILRTRGVNNTNNLDYRFHIFIYCLLYIPAFFVAKIYERKKF